MTRGEVGEPDPIDVDYASFELEDLVEMVSGVGVEVRGMDKAELIKNYKAYHDLRESSILPFLSLLPQLYYDSYWPVFFPGFLSNHTKD